LTLWTPRHLSQTVLLYPLNGSLIPYSSTPIVLFRSVAAFYRTLGTLELFTTQTLRQWAVGGVEVCLQVSSIVLADLWHKQLPALPSPVRMPSGWRPADSGDGGLRLLETCPVSRESIRGVTAVVRLLMWLSEW